MYSCSVLLMRVFPSSLQVIIDKTTQQGVSQNAQRDVRGDVDRAYAAYFPLTSSKDVCFELGRVLMGLKVAAPFSQHRTCPRYCA